MLISLEDPVTPVLSFPSWADQSIVLKRCKFEIDSGHFDPLPSETDLLLLSVDPLNSAYNLLLPGVTDLSWHNHNLRIVVASSGPMHTSVRLCRVKPFEPLIEVDLTGYDPTVVPHLPNNLGSNRQNDIWRRLDQEPWVRPPTKPVSQNPVVQRTAGGIRKFLSRVLKLR